MRLTIGRRHTVDINSLAAASVEYQRLRDASGEGASTWPTGRVRTASGQVYTITYNGRVWSGSRPVPGNMVLEAVRPAR